MSKLLYMYDSIVLNMPPNPEAVAGYVDGRWPDYQAMVAAYPHAHHVSIAVQADADAKILDREPGDASVEQVAGWMKRQLARGEALPGVYASASNMQVVINALGAAGIPREKYVLWTAHYTLHPHICGAASGCGYSFSTHIDATQYTDHANGLNLDESQCEESFFGVPVPKPDPYAIFIAGKFPIHEGNRVVLLNERQTVQTWDWATTHHPNSHRALIALLHSRLVFLRKWVWFRAHEDLGSPTWGVQRQPTWGMFNRGVRWKELLRRTDLTAFHKMFPKG